MKDRIAVATGKEVKVLAHDFPSACMDSKVRAQAGPREPEWGLGTGWPGENEARR